MLGAMQKLSDVLKSAYSQETDTAGQGLDEMTGQVCDRTKVYLACMQSTCMLSPHFPLHSWMQVALHVCAACGFCFRKHTRCT